jgi:biopolymer transport protein ExbD
MAASINSQDGEVGFQIAPMVDVVFVLMLFFMACAGFQATERELSIAMPGPASSGLPKEVAITVDISPDGQIIANGQTFGTATDRQLLAFRDWLKTVQGFATKSPVFIRPSADTRHERIMDVLSACRAAGIEKITFS